MGQGRRLDMPDCRVMLESPGWRRDVVKSVKVIGIIDDGFVDNRLIDVGDPGKIARSRSKGVGAETRA